jgi:hypothetical protein
VWFYSEGRNGELPVLSFAHFTDWLRAVAESEIPGWARRAQARPGNLTFFRIHADGRRTEDG